MDFRNVRFEEYNAVKTFFESFYGPNYCEVEKSYYSWLHHDSPFRARSAGDEEYTSFGAFDNGELVACINYVPFDLYVEGRDYPSCWSVGWLVKDGYSPVAGLLLKKHFRRFHYYMSMGATQWVREIYTSQFGFEYQHNIDRVVMVGNAGDTESILRENVRNIRDDFRALVDWEGETYQAAKNGSYELFDRLEDLGDQYWRDHLEMCRATVSKEPKVLRWRYFSNPNIPYDVVAPGDPKKTGFAILRREPIRDREKTVIRLVEFLPTHGHEKALTEALARYLVDNGALFMDFFCGSREYLTEHLPRPFIPESDHLPCMFPRMFQPLEWRDRYSINASFCRNKRVKDTPVVGLEEVYFTKGDPSQDIVLNREYVTRSL